MPTAILAGEPYSPEKLEALTAQFHREGYLYLGPILTPGEVETLRAVMERAYADATLAADEEADLVRDGFALMRMFEHDNAFRDLIVREPLAGLAEAIMGADCHIISQNALRTAHGEGVTGWHVDDKVNYPLPDSIPRHDARSQVPCLIANLMVPLSDIEAVEYGSSQVVPGSHYSGRHPVSQDEPHFEGQGPVSLLARAGDAYIFHNQLWHRGAPNLSQRVRYMGGMVYGQRTVAQRFYPFLNYRMPDKVLQGAGPRLLRMLGKHAKGSYG